MDKRSLVEIERHEGHGTVLQGGLVIKPGVYYELRVLEERIEHRVGGKIRTAKGGKTVRGRILFFFEDELAPLPDESFTLQLQNGSLLDFSFMDTSGNISPAGGIRKGPASN